MLQRKMRATNDTVTVACRVGRSLDIQPVAVTLTGLADDSTSEGVRRCGGGQ